MTLIPLALTTGEVMALVAEWERRVLCGHRHDRKALVAWAEARGMDPELVRDDRVLAIAIRGRSKRLPADADWQPW